VPAFAGVRVQAADQHVRLGMPNLVLQIVMQNPDDLAQQFRGDRIGMALSGRWVVTSATRSSSVASIITTFWLCERSSKNSVCPVKAIPASLMTPFVHRAGNQRGKFAAQATVAGARQRFNHVGRFVRSARRSAGVQRDGKKREGTGLLRCGLLPST
jgi:hypothetical protein